MGGVYGNFGYATGIVFGSGLRRYSMVQYGTVPVQYYIVRWAGGGVSGTGSYGAVGVRLV